MSVPTVAPGTVDNYSTLNWMLVAMAILLLVGVTFHFFGRGRTSAEARAGLALGLRGLLGKELRARSRGWRSVWLLSGYLALLAVAVVGFLALMRTVGGVVSPTVGPQLFSALGLGAVILLAFITPALTAGTISGERERRTLDLLLVTTASPFGLAAGKLAGSISYVLFLLVTALPAFAIVYLFGGVPMIYVVLVLAVAAITALAYASLGLLLSALLKRTIVASVVAYLLVLFLLFGLPFASAVAGLAVRQGSQGMPEVSGTPPVYLYASPLTSLSSVLPAGASGSGVPLIGSLLGAAVMGGTPYGYSGVSSPDITRAIYVVAVDQTTGQRQTVTRFAPWVYHFAFSGLLALFCLAGTALLLAPTKPWRRIPR